MFLQIYVHHCMVFAFDINLQNEPSFVLINDKQLICCSVKSDNYLKLYGCHMPRQELNPPDWKVEPVLIFWNPPSFFAIFPRLLAFFSFFLFYIFLSRYDTF